MSEKKLLKLNVGCYTVMFKDWLNIDVINDIRLYAYAGVNRLSFVSMDVTSGMLFDDNSIDLIFCSHMIEHLTYREAEAFLKECHRIMKPGACMRIGVPDLEIFVRLYQEDLLSKVIDPINEPSRRFAKYEVERFWEVLFADHKSLYDFRTLSLLAEGSGFPVITKCTFGEGHPIITSECQDQFKDISLYVEIFKGEPNGPKNSMG